MEDLVKETADQGGSDVKFREEQRQTGVTRLPQPQSLLIFLIDPVATQHSLKQLQEAEENHTNQWFWTFFKVTVL